jgi:hypothetical protein
MNFISIGGWCGTKIALKELNMFNEHSLPFDSVRSSMEGVIDCIETDFKHYFPEEIDRDPRFGFPVFVGEYIGFYHENHNLLDTNVIESFNRKIARFYEKIKRNNCVFLRTVVQNNYNDELKLYKKFHEIMKIKYPDISYILCFIIPNQPETKYYKHLDSQTFVFTVKHNDFRGQSNLGIAYKPIFDYISNADLFNTVPESDETGLAYVGDYLWLVVGIPMVNYKDKDNDNK